VQPPHSVDVIVQGGHTGGGQQGLAILAPLAVANDDLVPLEVEVLDPQAEALEQPHARPIQKAADQQRGAVEVGEHLFDLLGGGSMSRRTRSMSSTAALSVAEPLAIS
jgi:hypothetical protein